MTIYICLEQSKTEMHIIHLAKCRYMFTMGTSNSTSRYLSKRNKNTCPQKAWHKNIHSRFIRKRQHPETIQMSIN